MKIKASALLNTLTALYAIGGSLAFFFIQTAKLFSPARAKAEMVSQPMGLFDWGFAWADTLVATPCLLIGGILLFIPPNSVRRVGDLLVFSGFAVNLYAMITLWIGMSEIGHPWSAGDLWMNVVLTVLGILGMVFIAIRNSRQAVS